MRKNEQLCLVSKICVGLAASAAAGIAIKHTSAKAQMMCSSLDSRNKKYARFFGIQNLLRVDHDCCHMTLQQKSICAKFVQGRDTI